MSGDSRNVCQHREWTDRKIDTNEDGDAVRNDVANFSDEGDLDLMPSQYENLYNQATKTNGTLDDIVRRVKTIEDEMFHMPEVDLAVMPETGQRKQQFWGLWAVGKELPGLVEDFKAKLAEIDDRLAAIEDKTV